MERTQVAAALTQGNRAVRQRGVVNVLDGAGAAIGVDCLTCTLQELVVEEQGGQSTTDGLLVSDYPLVVRFAE